MLSDSKAYNILVIEDNPGDYALVKEFLSNQVDEFTFLQARNFREARETLSLGVWEFDVILLDLSLPDKAGLPLIEEVLAMSLDIPVIVLTGYADISFGVKSLSMGVSDYLLKDDLTPITLYKSIIYSSERKKSILALEESQKQYSELFHLSPQPMWVLDLASWYFLDVNKAAIKHYGYLKEEFLSMRIQDIGPVNEINNEALANCIEQNKLCPNGVFLHRKNNGDLILVDIQSNAIVFKGKKATIILANDVTERLNYIKAIETQNEKLREISWIQSHLVRTPVARILGLIQLINVGDEDPDEKEKLLAYLLQSANELDCVIKDITEKTATVENDSNFKGDLLLQYANYR